MRRNLGSTGTSVFAIGLGAMPLAISGRPSKKKAVEVIHAAINAGVDFIDTANAYCIDNNDMGYNEQTIALALRSHDKSNVIVATKGGLIRPQGHWERSGSPLNLRKACEKSLRDLDVDAIFLYQYHAPDPSVPFADSVGELSRLRSEGKILHAGLSNVDQSQLAEAMEIVPITSIQNRCHVYCQNDFRNGLVDYCRHHSVTYIPYSPVGGGHGHLRLRDDLTLNSIARNHGASVYQVALAWLVQKSENVIPIPGASKISSIESSAKAAKVQLSNEEILKIDELDNE